MSEKDVVATLRKILSVDVPAPEILIDSYDDLCLDWLGGDISVSITDTGAIAWAVTGGGHGHGVEEFLKVLKELKGSDK